MIIKEQFKKIPPVIWIICLISLIWAKFAPGFFTFNNLYNIGIQAAPLLILAIGETIVILTEGIDLSVGLLMGLAGVTCACLIGQNCPVWLAIVISLGAGILFGFINGFLVAKVKLPPFIATLGVGNIAFGITLLFTQGMSVPATNPQFRSLYDGAIFNLKIPLLLAIITFIIFWIQINKTKFGRNVFGLGGNSEALRLAGVNIVRAKISVYVISGFLAAFAGLIVAAKIASGHASSGMDWDFDAIAATIIGGTSFEEGKGGIQFTILGVLLITILRNGLNVAGVNNMYQYTLIGLIVLSAIIWDIKFKQMRQRQGGLAE
jgi:ribose transport system permease protein